MSSVDGSGCGDVVDGDFRVVAPTVGEVGSWAMGFNRPVMEDVSLVGH